VVKDIKQHKSQFKNSNRTITQSAKFFTDRVTAHFNPNFVAMATRVAQGKIWLAAFDGPTLKTSLQM